MSGGRVGQTGAVNTADGVSAVIDQMVATGRAEGDAGAIVEIASFAVCEPAGLYLERAAAALRPAATIEVGCASALSTLYICRGRLAAGALGPGSAHVVDPKQSSHWRNIGCRALRSAGLAEAIVFHEEPAHTALPRLLADGVRIGFAFLDGWHMLDFAMVEAFYCDRMLDVGGVIALHDLWMPGLQHFACYWCANRGYEPVTVGGGGLVPELEAGRGLSAAAMVGATPYFRERLAPFVRSNTLLMRKTREDDRGWDFFADFIG